MGTKDASTPGGAANTGFAGESGRGGIRTRGTGLGPYAALAKRCPNPSEPAQPPTDSALTDDDGRGTEPSGRSAGRFDPETDPELARLIELWPNLSPAQRAAVVSVVEASAGTKTTKAREGGRDE